MPPILHSPFSASASYRWLTCPASVALSEKAPRKKTTFEANEGTAAHELAEMSLTQRKMPRNFVGQTIPVGDELFEVTQEMADFVSEYVYEILQVASTRTNPGVKDLIKVETQFNLDWLGRPGMFGTNDASLADTVHRKLHVFDLKYGIHDPVTAEKNYQLMYYALGILGQEGVDKFDTVRLVIVQPRCHLTGTTDWEISVEDLLKWKDEVLIPAYDEACSENPRFCPSEKACKYCAGKPICPELGKQLTGVANTSLAIPQNQIEQITFPAPTQLTDEQIGKILLLMPLLKPYFESVQEMALARALNGDIIPGYKLVSGRQGNRTWKDEKAVAEAFASLGDDLWEKKLLSPAKLEKLIDKMDEKQLEPFVTRSEAKLTLATITDKREAIEPPNKNVLEEMFGGNDAD